MLPSSMDLSRLQLLVVSTAVGAGGLLVYFLVIRRRTKTKTLPMGDGWWGAGEKPLAEDEEIHPFQIVTSDEEIKDLYMRIDQTRFTPSLEDSQFNYGFNSTHLRKVVSYWRNQFDWKKQVKLLNKYPHFKTKIEGEVFTDKLHNIFIFYNYLFFFKTFDREEICVLNESQGKENY
ncbi:UNVERIFIED_CONTAM: hypothetical protein FKN15_059645 [Acipenser sinensis]